MATRWGPVYRPTSAPTQKPRLQPVSNEAQQMLEYLAQPRVYTLPYLERKELEEYEKTRRLKRLAETQFDEETEERLHALARPRRPRMRPVVLDDNSAQNTSTTKPSSTKTSEGSLSDTSQSPTRRGLPLPATPAEAEEQRVRQALSSRCGVLYSLPPGIDYDKLRKLPGPKDQTRLQHLSQPVRPAPPKEDTPRPTTADYHIMREKRLKEPLPKLFQALTNTSRKPDPLPHRPDFRPPYQKERHPTPVPADPKRLAELAQPPRHRRRRKVELQDHCPPDPLPREVRETLIQRLKSRPGSVFYDPVAKKHDAGGDVSQWYEGTPVSNAGTPISSVTATEISNSENSAADQPSRRGSILTNNLALRTLGNHGDSNVSTMRPSSDDEPSVKAKGLRGETTRQRSDSEGQECTIPGLRLNHQSMVRGRSKERRESVWVARSRSNVDTPMHTMPAQFDDDIHDGKTKSFMRTTDEQDNDSANDSGSETEREREIQALMRRHEVILESLSKEAEERRRLRKERRLAEAKEAAKKEEEERRKKDLEEKQAEIQSRLKEVQARQDELLKQEEEIRAEMKRLEQLREEREKAKADAKEMMKKQNKDLGLVLGGVAGLGLGKWGRARTQRGEPNRSDRWNH